MLTPEIDMELDSAILTEPAEVNVKVPKFVALPASLPSSTLPAVNSARPAIAKSPSLPSVIDPVALASRESPTTVPAKEIEPVAFVTATAPEAETAEVDKSPPPD